MNHRLEEANIYKSDFLAVMSHELRTPLTSIIAFTEIMLVDTPQEDRELHHNLQEVLQNSHILLRLINNILDMAKIEAGKDQLALDVVDMNDIVASVESVITPLARNKELTLHVQVAPEVPLTKADPEKIRRVVENLAGNAVKFTDKGGEVEILVQLDEASNEIIIKVNDNGIGVKEEYQKYIFEKFTQADSSSSRKYGGTGLGLSIVRKATERMGGMVGVESEPSQGSKFWLQLHAA
jgi:signal transduction histidine kinase